MILVYDNNDGGMHTELYGSSGDVFDLYLIGVRFESQH
jgi:hypothetical protein